MTLGAVEEEAISVMEQLAEVLSFDIHSAVALTAGSPEVAAGVCTRARKRRCAPALVVSEFKVFCSFVVIDRKRRE